MRQIFINARKDVTWLEDVMTVKGVRSFLVLDEPTSALIVRMYDRVEPVFLNQPTKEVKLTGRDASHVSDMLCTRFPPR